jgi:hypothetical protein
MLGRSRFREQARGLARDEHVYPLRAAFAAATAASPACAARRTRAAPDAASFVPLPLGRLTALAGLVLAGTAGGVRAEPPRQADLGGYARAHYDLLVVENCGLLNAELRRGFELELRDRLDRERLGDEEAEAARTQASLAFEREWHNRGLGGSRPWCREEGKRAALAFYGRLIDDRFALPAGARR